MSDSISWINDFSNCLAVAPCAAVDSPLEYSSIRLIMDCSGSVVLLLGDADGVSGISSSLSLLESMMSNGGAFRVWGFNLGILFCEITRLLSGYFRFRSMVVEGGDVVYRNHWSIQTVYRVLIDNMEKVKYKRLFSLYSGTADEKGL